MDWISGLMIQSRDPEGEEEAGAGGPVGVFWDQGHGDVVLSGPDLGNIKEHQERVNLKQGLKLGVRHV